MSQAESLNDNLVFLFREPLKHSAFKFRPIARGSRIAYIIYRVLANKRGSGTGYKKRNIVGVRCCMKGFYYDRFRNHSFTLGLGPKPRPKDVKISPLLGPS
ncbi:hypothetical protein CBL_07290 [Carabus blaptoides fortunei]